MELTGITLVLVSLAFFGSAAAETCRNGTRDPHRKMREKAATITAGTLKPVSWDKYFFGDDEPCFYNSGLDVGNLVKKRKTIVQL
uniref:Putative tick salivary peptide group 1 n=1 Tax=Ixodes ricinus TaxID=34613 RepID=V5IEP6_IXORI